MLCPGGTAALRGLGVKPPTYKVSARHSSECRANRRGTITALRYTVSIDLSFTLENEAAPHSLGHGMQTCNYNLTSHRAQILGSR